MGKKIFSEDGNSNRNKANSEGEEFDAREIDKLGEVMLSIKPYFFETEEDLSCLPSEDQTLLDDISEPPDEFRVKHFECCNFLNGSLK